MNREPKVVEETAPKPSPELEALIAEVQAVADAKVVADNAEPIVVHDAAGKEVRHLNMKLSALETVRVMSMPLEERANMATMILVERRIRANARKDQFKADNAYRLKRKQERRRKRKNQRRAR